MDLQLICILHVHTASSPPFQAAWNDRSVTLHVTLDVRDSPKHPTRVASGLSAGDVSTVRRRRVRARF